MYKLLLIWRYLIGKRVAFLAVAAVTLVVMLVLVVLSVMSGLLNDTLRRNHHCTGDIVITRSSLVGFPYYQQFIEQAKTLPAVDHATPVIQTIGLLGSRGKPIQVMGIDFPTFTAVTHWQDSLFRLSPDKLQNQPALADDLAQFSQARPPRCIVGQYLLGYDDIAPMDRTYLRDYGLGWSVTMFPISSRGTVLGTGLGQQQVFRYLDDSSTGLPRIDSRFIYVDFTYLQQLLMMDGTDGSPPRTHEIRLSLNPAASLTDTQQQLIQLWQTFIADYQATPAASLLNDVTVQTWHQYRRQAIAPAQKEKNLMTLVFLMIGLVVIFVVFAIFYLIVTEKIKDLGILKSIGASHVAVSQIFLGYGFVVGCLGGLFGTSLGALIVIYSNQIEAAIRRFLQWLNTVFEHFNLPWHFNDFYIWDPSVYAIDQIPNTVDFQQAVIIFVAAVIAAVAGAALPARRAARLRIIETLQLN